MCPEWLAHTHSFLTAVGNTRVQWNSVSSFSGAFVLIIFPRERGELELWRGMVDAGWAPLQGELQPPPCSPSERPDKLKRLRGWRDKSEATVCSAQKRKRSLCGLNWHILFLTKYRHLHLMQFMLKPRSCCAMGKDLMLKVLKHMFGFTPTSCPVETEDVLKVIGLLCLWGEAYALVFVGLCG